MWSTRYACSILMNFEFSKQIFEKYSNTKSHENPSGVSRDVACEQKGGLTERHDENNSGFSQFYERA